MPEIKYPFGTYVVAKPNRTIHKIEAHSLGNIGPLKVLRRGPKSEPLELGLDDDQIEAGWKIMKAPEKPDEEPEPAVLPRMTTAPEAPEA